MPSIRWSRGYVALSSLFVTSLFLGSGCTGGDGDVHFDPLSDTNTGASAGDQNAAGSKLTSAGSSTGAQPSAGSSSGGSDAGGTDAGGADMGGTDTGGTDVGGSAGTSSGGQGGSAGSSAGTASGGMAGNGGSGGKGGAGGSGGGSACAPKLEVCDGVDNDCDKVIDPEDTCPAGCTGATYEGHSYYFCGVVHSATAAATKCAGYGMAMVAIESKEENAFVIGKLTGTSWIGASDNDQEDEWRWLSGAMFWDHGSIDGQYHNWQDGQPNDDGPQGASEDCAVVQYSAAGASRGFWNDLVCDAEVYRATCESTGLVVGPIPL